MDAFPCIPERPKYGLNKKIKVSTAQKLTQVSEDEVRKSFANLSKYGLIELSGKDEKREINQTGKRRQVCSICSMLI
jgi:ribosomal protein S19E (S16A)